MDQKPRRFDTLRCQPRTHLFSREAHLLASPQSELSAALAACRSALIAIAAFSAVSNILMLTGSVFMLEVYDRVLPSRSVPTLIGLCVIAAFLFGMLAIIDIIRSRIMVRIGASLDEALSGRVYETLVKIPLRADNRLSPEGSFRTPLPALPITTPELQLAEMPGNFRGTYERSQALRGRLDNLSGQVAVAATEQARLLQSMSLQELEAQKKQIERYMVESRFALARLYDRQRRGQLNDE